MGQLLRVLIRRLVSAAPVVLGVIVITFVLSRVVPGNPALLMAGVRATPEQIASITHDLGLDQPIQVQFYIYLSNLIAGKWGNSYVANFDVLTSIFRALPNSLTLITLSTIFSFAVAVPIGVIMAVKKDTWVDYLLRLVSAAAIALPSFWLGMVLQLVFVSSLGLFPLYDIVTAKSLLNNPIPQVTNALLVDSLIAGRFSTFLDVIYHLILPSITLAVFAIGLMARQVRSAMISVLSQDYIRTARAYGLPERHITFRLALKNAIAPALVVMGLVFAGSLVSVFFVESIFGLPGIGTLTTTAIKELDYPLVLGTTFFIAIFYVIVNITVDMGQMFLDKRIRL